MTKYLEVFCREPVKLELSYFRNQAKTKKEMIQNAQKSPFSSDRNANDDGHI
jgi:hypothetical protein